MTPEQQQIVEKIKKLLRMQRGGTPAEVETALALAAELARKHGIDLASVNPDESTAEPIGHVDTVATSRLQWECKYSAMLVQSFFNVEALLRAKGVGSFWRRRGRVEHRITFIGTAWDTQIAVYVYHFLVQQFRWAWKTRRGRARNRHAFMHGMYQGIFAKLHAAQCQQVSEAGLVLLGKAVTERKAYLDRHWPNNREVDAKCDSDATAAANAGYLAGKDTEIRTGLTHQGSAAPLLQ